MNGIVLMAVLLSVLASVAQGMGVTLAAVVVSILSVAPVWGD